MMTSPLPSSSETTELNDNDKLNKSLEHVHIDENSQESPQSMLSSSRDPDLSQANITRKSETNGQNFSQKDHSPNIKCCNCLDIYNSSSFPSSSSSNADMTLRKETEYRTPFNLKIQLLSQLILQRYAISAGIVAIIIIVISQMKLSTTKTLVETPHYTEPLRMVMLNA